MFFSIRAFDLYQGLYSIARRGLNFFGNFSSFLPDIDPGVAVVQLKELRKTCFFTHMATFFRCISGQMGHMVCSSLILQEDQELYQQVITVYIYIKQQQTNKQTNTHIFFSFCGGTVFGSSISLEGKNCSMDLADWSSVS